jgi:hypothetical protein
VVADESGVRLVTKVTDDQPLESFAALLQHGQADKAFSGMQVSLSDALTHTAFVWRSTAQRCRIDACRADVGAGLPDA